MTPDNRITPEFLDSDQFSSALMADFERNGNDTITLLRRKQPAEYLKLIVILMPHRVINRMDQIQSDKQTQEWLATYAPFGKDHE